MYIGNTNIYKITNSVNSVRLWNSSQHSDNHYYYVHETDEQSYYYCLLEYLYRWNQI